MPVEIFQPPVAGVAVQPWLPLSTSSVVVPEADLMVMLSRNAPASFTPPSVG